MVRPQEDTCVDYAIDNVKWERHRRCTANGRELHTVVGAPRTFTTGRRIRKSV